MKSNKEFFDILSEFFIRMTGKKYNDFCVLGKFSETIRKNANEIVQRGFDAWKWGIDNLANFYQKTEMSAFSESRNIGGQKIVIGGGNHFLETQLRSTLKMLLYTDTILIPDPILPWLEIDRSEEKFRHANLLENAFHLLHLKPFIDSNVPYPAIIVFPSYEKSLEEKDNQTKDNINNLFSSVLSHYLKHNFKTPLETLEFARSESTDFLNKVEAAALFVPPEGIIGMPITSAINQYKVELSKWRSKQHVYFLFNLSDAELVWNGIFERLTPQWHIFENSNELSAQPMFCLDAHWHYYQLCTNAFNNNLTNNNIIDQKTLQSLRALSSPQLSWLGNVPINQLVKMREENENEDFRNKLNGYISQLNDVSLSNIDMVAGQISRGIASLLIEHKKQSNKIVEKYSKIHGQTLTYGWLTLGATFLPMLAPFISAMAPLSLTGKYVFDKISEIKEKSKLSKSLLGILATAKND